MVDAERVEHTMLTIHQIAFIANECKRQKSGEMSVLRLCQAWARAMETPVNFFDASWIYLFAEYIEHENAKGFRKTPVFFNSTGLGATHPDNIGRAMLQLIDAYNNKNIDIQKFYEEFELIHPFEDGNGRLGVLLFNWQNRTLKNPKTPAKFLANGLEVW